MVTRSESKDNHYYITKGICADPGGLRPLGLRVRIPPVACTSVSCECLALSGRGVCYGGDQRQRDVPRNIAQAVMILTCIQ
jgi:hypothetical protein